MVPNEAESLVVERAELPVPGDLLARPVVVQLLHTVERQRLVVEVKLVGEELGTRLEERKIRRAPDTYLAHALALAWVIKRLGAPVLEASDEGVLGRVRLRFSCRKKKSAHVLVAKFGAGETRKFDSIQSRARDLAVLVLGKQLSGLGFPSVTRTLANVETRLNLSPGHMNATTSLSRHLWYKP